MVSLTGRLAATLGMERPGSRRVWKQRERAAVLCTVCQDLGVLYTPHFPYFEGSRPRPCLACDYGRQREEEYQQTAAHFRQEQEAHIREVCQRALDEFSLLHQVPDRPLPRNLAAFAHTWDGHQGLLALGPFGVGKTWRMVALMRFLLERAVREGWTMKAVTVAELLNELRAGQDADDAKASYYSVLNRYQTAGLLLLDDLGKENQTTWTDSQLLQILDERYRKRLPVLVTTNLELTPKDDRQGRAQQPVPSLTTHYPAILERLKEMCLKVHLTGTSHRVWAELPTE